MYEYQRTVGVAYQLKVRLEEQNTEIVVTGTEMFWFLSLFTILVTVFFYRSREFIPRHEFTSMTKDEEIPDTRMHANGHISHVNPVAIRVHKISLRTK